MDGRSGKKRRGQSETLGFILLFGMVLLGASTIVTFGVAAVDSSEERLSVDRAEKVMTQMDSEISLVALGRTDSQQLQFDRVSGEQFTVVEDAGEVNITRIGENSTDVLMDDVALGTIEFEKGDTVIAYQGGGVWRSDGPGSSMISPPEFHYRDRTLTLPLVTVSGERSLGSGSVIEKDENSTTYYPTEAFPNPLEDDVVQVTVESEFHHGWKSYFETRTEGNVTHDPANQRVSVNLTAPAIETFDHGAATTSNEAPESGPQGEIEKRGAAINAPSASDTVDGRIDTCEAGGCTAAGGSFGGETLSAGQYYEDSGLVVNQGTEFDTSGGDIEVIVDGDLTFDGNSGPDQVITGNGQVRFYVKGDITTTGSTDVNVNGDSEDLLLLAHTEADRVDIHGNSRLTGLIYAPSSTFTIDGGAPGQNEANIEGSVIAETIDASNGYVAHQNPNNFVMELGTGVNVLTFLHISTNPVTVTG